MAKYKKQCTIVVPCYNEEAALPLFYQEMEKVLKQVPELVFEYLFIDDGSNDQTLAVMKNLKKKDTRIHYVSFSRNFGKEAAMYAGLKKASGDYVVIMDVDLQDPPALLLDMYRAVLEEGYDCAAARRVSRKGEPPIRSYFARKFYLLMSRISKIGIVDGARDYRFMKRSVVDAILSMSEYNRFTKGIFEWVGFQTKYLEYENIERSAGETKWSFWKLFKYSIEGIVAFSTTPLYIASAGGILLCMIGFIMVLFIALRALLFGDPVSGWPSLVCIIMFMGGVQLLCLGVLGVYLSKTYLECKRRPIYIEKGGEEDESEAAAVPCRIKYRKADGLGIK